MDITIYKFPSICRFCLIKSEDLRNILDVPYVGIFETVTGIRSDDSTLPGKLCSSCINIFQTFSNFIELSKNNINKLTRIYTVTTQETNLTLCDNESEYNKKKCQENVQIKRETRNSSPVCFDNSDLDDEDSNHCQIIEQKILLTDVPPMENQNGKCIDNASNFKDTSIIFKKKISVSKFVMCKNCKCTFNTKIELVNHSKNGFTCEKNDYKCMVCNKLFKKRHRLINHMRSHTKEAPYKCPTCEKSFRFQQNLRRHLLIHEGVKNFKCQDCGKAFSRATVLNEHRNIHTGNNPYICDYCGKGFKRYANHFIHVYRHKLMNGEVDETKDKKLYLQLQCDICQKIFASRGGLENHLILHEKEPRIKNFLCTDCGKGFGTISQLGSHMRIHTDDRPFECTQCNKKFKRKSAFSNHQLVHSGRKPYQCKLCERFFTQTGHLKVHMRVHSGEKPFICNFCGKKFALKSNLKVHTRTHTGEKPYVCSVCTKSYYDSTSLKKHMKSHGMGLPSHGHL